MYAQIPIHVCMAHAYILTRSEFKVSSVAACAPAVRAPYKLCYEHHAGW